MTRTERDVDKATWGAAGLPWGPMMSTCDFDRIFYDGRRNNYRSTTLKQEFSRNSITFCLEFSFFLPKPIQNPKNKQELVGNTFPSRSRREMEGTMTARYRVITSYPPALQNFEITSHPKNYTSHYTKTALEVNFSYYVSGDTLISSSCSCLSRRRSSHQHQDPPAGE